MPGGMKDKNQTRDKSPMDTLWQKEFRERMDAFAQSDVKGMLPVSIKLRIRSGCFHREHSPEAYRLIDDYLIAADLSDLNYQIQEHETGPEILAYVALAAAGLGFAKSIVELVTTIIKARQEGIKKGDKPSDPLELVVRGFSRGDEYFEETLLRIPPDHPVTAKQIRDALEKTKPQRKTQKKSRSKK